MARSRTTRIGGTQALNKRLKKLKDIGVKDSKLLPQFKREIMFDKILKISKNTKIIKIKPSEIDKTILSTASNLNWLESEKSAQIINEFKPDEVILDAPHPIPEKYENYTRELLLNKKIKINLLKI